MKKTVIFILMIFTLWWTGTACAEISSNLNVTQTFTRHGMVETETFVDEQGNPVLAEDLGYSDPVGSAALEETERDLSALVDELQSAVADGDSEATRQLCRRASAVLAERNRLCKLSKH